MPSQRRIDSHHHIVPPFYAEATMAAGAGPTRGKSPDWSLQLGIDLMDAARDRCEAQRRNGEGARHARGPRKALRPGHRTDHRGNPERLAGQVKSEIAKWAKIVKESGARVE